MNTKFTPGPWRYCPTNNGHMIGGSSNGYIAEVRQVREVTEDKANAHLIAAAPDLYEALSDLIVLASAAMQLANRDGAEFNVDDDLREARAALKKARGES
jgi:hypothetical protein